MKNCLTFPFMLATLLVAGLLLTFSGSEVSAQEAGPTATPIVVNSDTPQSGSRVISSQFIGPEITDCPRLQICPTTEQAIGVLTFEGKIFGLTLTKEQEKDLTWFLLSLSVDQSHDLWDLAPNVGGEVDGKEMVEVSRILSRYARHHADVALLQEIFGIAFPPAPAPGWESGSPRVTHIEILE